MNSIMPVIKSDKKILKLVSVFQYVHLDPNPRWGNDTSLYQFSKHFLRSLNFSGQLFSVIFSCFWKCSPVEANSWLSMLSIYKRKLFFWLLVPHVFVHIIWSLIDIAIFQVCYTIKPSFKSISSKISSFFKYFIIHLYYLEEFSFMSSPFGL